MGFACPTFPHGATLAFWTVAAVTDGEADPFFCELSSLFDFDEQASVFVRHFGVPRTLRGVKTWSKHCRVVQNQGIAVLVLLTFFFFLRPPWSPFGTSLGHPWSSLDNHWEAKRCAIRQEGDVKSRNGSHMAPGDNKGCPKSQKDNKIETPRLKKTSKMEALGSRIHECSS